MSQKFSGNKFQWTESTSQFHEDFIKNYSEEGHEGYFLEVEIHYPETLLELHNGLPFLPERMKIEKVENLLLIYMIKLNMSFT